MDSDGVEWVRFWREPVGLNSDKARPYFMINQNVNIHSAGVGVNSYSTG